MSTSLKAFCIAFIFLLFLHKIGGAQTSTLTYQLSGKIVDSVSQEPLSFLTISLKNNKGEVLRRLVTKDNGSFVFKELQANSYQVSIIAIGYQQKDFKVSLSKAIDLKLIYLKQQTNALNEVGISTDRPIIQHKADRIIYDLQADPESKGSSVLTMMHKIPFISVDASDHILLKGNSSYQILINGKPSSLLKGNLSAVLRSMPATTIQKIEVITVPSAKYDAEGLAGIINIITNKKRDDGYNGNLNLNESGPVGGPGTGASFTAKLGKFGVAAFAGGGIQHTPLTHFVNSRVGIAEAISNLHQEGFHKSNQRNGYFGSQISYEIDSLNLLSGQFNINGSRSKGTQSLASILSGTNTADQRYALENRNTSSSLGLDAALNYQLGFKASKHRFLTFSYQYSTNPNDQHTAIDFSNQLHQNTSNYQQSNQEKFKEQTVQLDYVNRVKMVNIETGIKAIFRKNASDFQYNALNESNGYFELDPSLADQYHNTQNVLSAYNSYQLNLKEWTFNLGLRFEHTAIRADFISSGAIADQEYSNVVPTIAVSKNFENKSSVNFGWSQRIRRPGINRLNPYTDRSNPNLETTGNPNLRPVLMNSLQAGYQLNKKLSVTIGLDYSFMNNLDLKVTNYNPTTQLSTITYENIGKAKSLGMNFNLGYPFNQWYNLSINGQLMYLWLSGPSDGLMTNNDRYVYFLAIANAFQITDGWRVNANINLISRNPNGLQGTSNGMISTAFGLSKELIKSKLGFAAGIKNPFRKYRNQQNQWFGANFQQYSLSKEYFRSFNISLNYNFGGLKDDIKKSKSEIRNNDLSN